MIPVMTHSSGIQKIGLFTAIAYVIANMVGTGVFTSLGFQLAGGVTTVFALMMLWLMGGIIAFTGAQVYGELGSVMPRSGGEYHYLGLLYAPWVGYLSGFFSAFIGFAAPIALAAMALGEYFSHVYAGINPKFLALLVILAISIIHIISVRGGGRFQLIFTFLKITLILVFVVCGFVLVENPQPVPLIPDAVDWQQLVSAGFAVSLIYVYYSYSGWNAASYFVGELKNPLRNLNRSLIYGTLIVTLLYLLINFIFLYTTPKESMTGKLDIGAISATYIFGTRGGIVISLFISLLLISTISSMIFAGPRVIQVMGEDYPSLSFLGKRRKNGVPLTAILLQSGISIILLLTSTFEALLTYLGFLMNIFAFLTVAGVYVHRIRYPQMIRPYKTWGYPIVPAIFLIFVIWNMIYLFRERTLETLLGLLTLLVGLILYGITHWTSLRKKISTNQRNES